MRTITVNNSRVTLGSNAVPSALNEGPETTENFLAALADAIALAGRGGVRFVANGTHYSLNRRREVNREEYAAPLWSPKGTPVTWDDTDGSGAGTTTGLYSVMGPFASGLTYYQVIRNDGQHYWVTNPTPKPWTEADQSAVLNTTTGGINPADLQEAAEFYGWDN